MVIILSDFLGVEDVWQKGNNSDLEEENIGGLL